MAISGTVIASGKLSGLPSGAKDLLLQWVIASGVADIQTTTINGNVTITAPSGATLVAIVPPVANASQLILKGIAGDTGVALSRTKPSLIGLDATAFILNSPGVIVGVSICFL